MAHFALVDENNIVQNVLVVRNIDCVDSNGKFSETVANEFLNANGHAGRYIQTSYNTFRNVHLDPITRLPDGGTAIRGNFAGVGGIYDSVNDVFYEQKPYPSWILNQSNWAWEPPVARPQRTQTHIPVWNESKLEWDMLTLKEIAGI